MHRNTHGAAAKRTAVRRKPDSGIGVKRSWPDHAKIAAARSYPQGPAELGRLA